MKKHKKIQLIVLAVTIILAGAAAQAADSFRIEDYIPERLVDLEWRLNGNLRLLGNDQDSHADQSPGSYLLLDRSSNEHRDFDFTAGTDLAYRYETVPKFLRCRLSLNTSFEDYRSESSSDRLDTLGMTRRSSSTTERDSWRFVVEESLEAGTYFWRDQFVSVASSASALYSEQPNQDERNLSIEEYIAGDYYYYNLRRRYRTWEATDRNYYGQLELRTGWGRAYEGWYAATAKYMIDELNKVGVLKNRPSTAEMVQLCDLIYQNHLQHAVDKRLSKIEALDQIYEYLNSIGATDRSHVGYLAVQDVWDYFPKTSRRFGTVISGRVGWEYSYSKRSEDYTTRDVRFYTRYELSNPEAVDTLTDTSYMLSGPIIRKSQSDNVFLALRFEHYRPVNMRVQFDLSGDAFYFIHAEHIRSVPVVRATVRRFVAITPGEKQDIDDYYGLRLAGNVTYIKSSRTSADLYAGMSYDNYRARAWGSSEARQKNSRTSFALESTLTYRVSIPTTLRATARYDTRTDENELLNLNESTSSNWSLSAYLSHYLF